MHQRARQSVGIRGLCFRIALLYTNRKEKTMQKTKELSDNKQFSEICSEWLSMERLIVKRSTYAKYTFTINNHILPVLGRHTFASRCVESGFDVKTLSEILGHSGTEITLNYYVHSSMDNKRRQMELLTLTMPDACKTAEPQ